MKVKTEAPKEDPETKALRMVEEARAEADRTSATQGLLSRRQRRIMRIFGAPNASGPAAGGSGSSGVIGNVPQQTTFGRTPQDRFESVGSKYNKGYLF